MPEPVSGGRMQTMSKYRVTFMIDTNQTDAQVQRSIYGAISEYIGEPEDVIIERIDD